MTERDDATFPPVAAVFPLPEEAHRDALRELATLPELSRAERRALKLGSAAGAACLDFAMLDTGDELPLIRRPKLRTQDRARQREQQRAHARGRGKR